MSDLAYGNITFKQLRVFLTAAEYENFSLTAERLYITQPLVSYTIAQLEQELGYPLFDREKKRVRLNPAGRVLKEKLKNIDSLISGAIESGRQVYENSNTNLVISLPMSADNREYFFPILSLFTAEYPNVHLKADQMEIGNAVNQVIAGIVDLSFTVYPEASRFENLPIDWDLIAPCLTYAEVPLSSPLSAKKILTLKDLVDQPLALIAVDGVSGYTEALLNLFAQHKLRPTATYYVSSTAALEMTSALGEGIVIHPSIHHKPAERRSCFIPIQDVPNGIIGFWRKSNPNPLLHKFISLAKSYLQNHLS